MGWTAGLLLAAVLLGGCFLKGRSPLHAIHPEAKVLLEDATEARYSPDGRYLAYVRMEGGKSWTADIWIRDRKTDQERRITGNPDYDGQPTWAPDSRLLVYTSRRRGAFNLYLASVAEPGERQLTWAGGRQPDFSPDGQSVVYTSDEMGGLDLFIMPPTGGISRRLTEDAGREWFPRYSPDGRYIAFVSDAAGSDDLWLMERDTGRRERLTNLPGSEVQPSWAPDSRMLVFASDASSGAPERLDLYALPVTRPPAALPPTALTRCPGLMCQSTYPSFSPDGVWLIFTTELNPLQRRLAQLAVEETAVGQPPGKG